MIPPIGAEGKTLDIGTSQHGHTRRAARPPNAFGWRPGIGSPRPEI